MNNLCTFCFRNLGVGTRLKMYEYLVTNGSKNVSEITNFIGLRQPTVSYHLKEMYESGLLAKKQKGKAVYYSVNSVCPHLHTECVIQVNNVSNTKFARKAR